MSSAIDADHTIAFMGVEGANADLACRQNYPYMRTLPCASFEEAFNAVAEGRAKYAMIPIENSHAGRVAEIHNLLPKTQLHIVAEHIEPIQHHLFALPGTRLEDVKTVYSHAQALMQCRSFIQQNQVETHIHGNTATAAKDVAGWGDRSKAAICSKLAGELYRLECIAENIQDVDDNETLFVVLSKDAEDIAEGTKVLTSIIFTVRNIPAALYKAMGGFATNNVNMIKLESYIRGTGLRESAQFFMTFEGDPHQRPVQLALEELGFFTRKVNVLGVYPADKKRYANG